MNHQQHAEFALLVIQAFAAKAFLLEELLMCDMAVGSQAKIAMILGRDARDLQEFVVELKKVFPPARAACRQQPLF